MHAPWRRGLVLLGPGELVVGASLAPGGLLAAADVQHLAAAGVVVVVGAAAAGMVLGMVSGYRIVTSIKV